ncbi:hypothetical protein ASG22_18060 [Chryseobacterium sp. Leaf405]|uniref:microviridin/marinostatin family tricyclic proteinase inhibitor n=1 Tax=Chryseobacterium sp. Leaf405 TaxID=1736367 RepID=UPI0006F75665|nr:microviridin/marinostatin family tricyclic proteinase inhibitor [Chryseobacterium sp. Leaf405]KQT33126.1 hypothetical protein ASG22_18060 [Chryseobacterium sp. Leaf405]
MKNNDSKKKPFFASLLEKQIQDPEKIQGGGLSTSLKDVVTSPTGDVVTLKTLDNVTTPAADTPVTLKYPSDSDEGGFDPGNPGLDPHILP